MIVLDTNVLSELMRPVPSPTVMQWIESQPIDALCISSITMAEILHGVSRLPDGQRKHHLHTCALAMFEEDFAERIIPFDADAAYCYAQLVCTRERSGRPLTMADAQIAAVCRAHGATIATRNVKDFTETGISIIDPWQFV